MKSKVNRRVFSLAVAAATLLLAVAPPVSELEALPRELSLRRGESLELSFGLPGSIALDRPQAVETISSKDQRPTGRSVSISNSGFESDARVTFRLLGMLPLKTVSVAMPKRLPNVLIPGGHSLGVALLTEGVVVVGASDLGSVPSPARLAGLKSGDRITSVNGTAVESAVQLSGLVKDGSPCALEVVRNSETLRMDVTPLRDRRDGSYRLGIWVRDSTAGIGTLSFYDPDNGSFGALGHAVADADTGVLLPVSEGAIYESSVVDVSKGRQGVPGELIGQFAGEDRRLGEITENTEYGIFGRANSSIINPLYPEGLPVATRKEVHTGPAQLLTTLSGDKIQAYDCDIVKVNPADRDDARSLMLQITDPVLLEATGGIVQGMSGSPIIQDGHLVGAVTHVLVNDPTRGYGILIERMLEASNSKAP